MNSLFLLIPIAFIFVVLAIKLFVWAVRNGQYDDLDTEGRRILFDEDDGAERAADRKKREKR